MARAKRYLVVVVTPGWSVRDLDSALEEIQTEMVFWKLLIRIDVLGVVEQCISQEYSWQTRGKHMRRFGWNAFGEISMVSSRVYNTG